MPRPPIGDPILVRLPADLADWVAVTAAEEGISRAELIRRAVIAARIKAERAAKRAT